MTRCKFRIHHFHFEIFLFCILFKELNYHTFSILNDDFALKMVMSQLDYNNDTVDSAFNELGYNDISEFLNIHFFKTD